VDKTVVTCEANKQGYTGKAVDAMSDQQMTSAVTLSLGVAALIISAGVAWTLSRIARTRQIDGVGFIAVVCFLLFLVGIVLCWFGISALVEGR
jgi:choline-glycine betaine transporter